MQIVRLINNKRRPGLLATNDANGQALQRKTMETFSGWPNPVPHRFKCFKSRSRECTRSWHIARDLLALVSPLVRSLQYLLVQFYNLSRSASHKAQAKRVCLTYYVFVLRTSLFFASQGNTRTLRSNNSRSRCTCIKRWEIHRVVTKMCSVELQSSNCPVIDCDDLPDSSDFSELPSESSSHLQHVLSNNTSLQRTRLRPDDFEPSHSPEQLRAMWAAVGVYSVASMPPPKRYQRLPRNSFIK